MLVETYDAVIRAFRWPVIANAVLTAIALPVILVTGVVPPEALTEWTWISAGLSGALFVLIAPDMRTQRAVGVANRLLREHKQENGYWSMWSNPLELDWKIDLLMKIMVVEYGFLFLTANWSLIVHMFAGLCGLMWQIFASLKYNPVIQERLATTFPAGAGYAHTLPTERVMARLWIVAGILGICIAAVMAVACFAFGLTFYYHFGPLYGEAVSPKIMAAILGALALAFGLLTLRGWLILRKPVAAALNTSERDGSRQLFNS